MFTPLSGLIPGTGLTGGYNDTSSPSPEQLYLINSP